MEQFLGMGGGWDLETLPVGQARWGGHFWVFEVRVAGRSGDVVFSGPFRECFSREMANMLPGCEGAAARSERNLAIAPPG